MISILVATADCGPYIRCCLESIVQNTFSDWELLILDDHSIDNTLKVIQKFVLKSHKIKILTHPRKLYCGAAFDYLSKFVKGDLVCVVDGDDAITKDAMEKVKAAYDKYPNLDYIYTQHFTCSTDLKEHHKGISSLPLPGYDLVTSWENRKHCFSHMRTCRSSMLKYHIFNPELKFSVDKYMGMMLESHGYGGFLDEVTYFYRLRPWQLTGKFRKQRDTVKRYCINSIRQYRKQNNLTSKPIVAI